MSRPIGIPLLSPGLRRRHVVTLAIAIFGLLPLAAPVVRAQGDWGGRVEIDTNGDGIPDTPGVRLEVDEGGSVSYRVRLSKPPVIPSAQEAAGKTWWIILRVDGYMRATGEHGGIKWRPAIGRQFTESNWNEWYTITIEGKEDEDGSNPQPISFEHEVWDHDENCPFKGSPLTVQVNDDDGPTARLPALTIQDVTVDEGRTAEFQVTMSQTSSDTVTVAYATADGSATAGSDYTSRSGTLTFTSGSRSRTISVPTTQDTNREEDETFTVRLSSPSGATLARSTATGTVEDDDNWDEDGENWDVAIDDVTVEEGENAVFTVSLNGGSQAMRVAYATEGGTATATSDYSRASGTLVLAPGGSERIAVQTAEDTTPEPTETFSVTLTKDADNSFLASATGTITDDDNGNDGGRVGGRGGTEPTLSVADAAASEGDPARFTVTLSATSTGSVTVTYATASGTAEEGADYTATSGTLKFAPGEDTRTIPVPTLEDELDEPAETFTLSLANPDGATIRDGTATGTINDDDEAPVIVITDAEAEEGETAEFTVTLSATSTRAVSMTYATAGVTAEEGADYTATSGILTFAPGEVARTIPVPTREDELDEPAETFTVSLSIPYGATIEGGTGIGTIIDDDEAPVIVITDAEAEEGETAEFTVSLSAVTSRTVTVDYATTGGTAEQGADYAATSGTLTFAPGEESRTIPVPTREDELDELTETFTVNLGNPDGATIRDGAATGSIVDDDEPPAIVVADAEAEEGEVAEFTVSLSAITSRTVTIDYATAGGTAEAGADYAATSGTLTFAPGEDARTIRVPTREDELDELTETFALTLGNPAAATIRDGAATGTIIDDDEPPVIVVTDGEAEEGDPVEFTVALSAVSSRTVTVDYATTGGTAEQGADYTATFGTLTFVPGEEAQTIAVLTREDEIDERNEAFTLDLGNPHAATIHDGAATGTIVDDDEPVLYIGDAEAREGDAAEFLVTMWPAGDETVTVSFRTVDGTAVAGLDYTSTLGTLRFEPGETSVTIAVSTLTDELADDVERFTLELSDPVEATVADATGVGTITDDPTARITAVNRTILPELGRVIAFNAVTCRFDRPLSTVRAGNGTRSSAGGLSLSHQLLAAGRRISPTDPWSSPAGSWSSLAADPWDLHTPTPLTLEQALGNSSFLMPSTTGEGTAGRYTAWGCADYYNLAGGRNGSLSWDGVAFSAQIGADVVLSSNTLAGVAVSRSRSSFNYTGLGGGADDVGVNMLRLTGVNPYLAWSITPQLDVWGTVGHAWGELQIDDKLGAGSLSSLATLNSGMVGINGRLLARGGTTLRLRGEGGLAHLGVAGDGDILSAVGLDMRRVRLSTEASYEHVFPFEATLTPWGELGLRHDGGDGETGAGLEVRGGLRYRHVPRGLTVEGYARRLVVHEGAVRESGVGLLVRVDPGESGLGPSMSLTPAWGETAGGLQQLWDGGANAFMAYDRPGPRMDARFAYGVPALRGRGLLTSFGTVNLARQLGQGYGLGTTLAVGRTATVSLEAERRRRLAARAIYAVMLRGMLQF